MEKSTRYHRPKQLVRKKVTQGIHPVLSARFSRQPRTFLVIRIVETEEKSMILNGMEVIQRNGLYYVFTQYGELKSVHYLPDDGQLMADFKVMDHITKATALRWGIISPKKKNS